VEELRKAISTHLGTEIRSNLAAQQAMHILLNNRKVNKTNSGTQRFEKMKQHKTNSDPHPL